MGRTLWRGEPQEGLDGRSARVGDRTSPCREESPEADRVLVCTSRCGARAGNDRRAGPPRGGTAAHGEEALKGEAHGRSGASRAGRCDGVAAQEVAKPPYVAGWAAGGTAVVTRHRAENVSKGQQSPGEVAWFDVPAHGPAEPCGAATDASEGAGKRKEGPRAASVAREVASS